MKQSSSSRKHSVMKRDVCVCVCVCGEREREREREREKGQEASEPAEEEAVLIEPRAELQKKSGPVLAIAAL